ncbi:hypothetical protein PPYR_09445 [Photinus pyralis]|uniref:RING-type domain-containing protein n=1 Tax=Photinus pyralis TaxID=7054 RepID=A0A1Y1N3R0_PHOPY|nr:uncharacterized protein LOC116171865 [Photinus pyralis]KAB0798452.1 hypothetical protein PPYR_09445 [Photinus pyralis]
MANYNIPQWGWRDLEDILQCHICMDIVQSPPGSIIEQCIHGHHICANCRARVENCPTCKCTYIGTRNFVVEELVKNFEILKNIMNLYEPLEEPPKDNTVQLNASAPAFDPTVTTTTTTANGPGKGIYPCRVDNCDVRLPASRLLNHVRSFHADKLTESALDGTGSFTKEWEFSFNTPKLINRMSFVIFVSGIGVVFLNIEILRTGHLAAFLRANMKYTQAQRCLASLEFYSENGSYLYSTQLVSVKDNIENMLNKKNCFVLTKHQLKALCVSRKFHLRLKLSRYDTITQLSTPNTEQIGIVALIRKGLCEEEKKNKPLKKTEKSNDKKTKKADVVNRNQPQSSASSTELFDKEKIIKDILDTIRNNGLISELFQNNSNLAHVNTPPVPPPTAPSKGPSRRRKNRRR